MVEKTVDNKEEKKETEQRLRYIKTRENGEKQVEIKNVTDFNKVVEGLDASFSEVETLLNKKIGTIMVTQSPHLDNKERDRILYIIRSNFGIFYVNTKKEIANEMADIILSRF